MDYSVFFTREQSEEDVALIKMVTDNLAKAGHTLKLSDSPLHAGCRKELINAEYPKRYYVLCASEGGANIYPTGGTYNFTALQRAFLSFSANRKLPESYKLDKYLTAFVALTGVSADFAHFVLIHMSKDNVTSEDTDLLIFLEEASAYLNIPLINLAESDWLQKIQSITKDKSSTPIRYPATFLYNDSKHFHALYATNPFKNNVIDSITDVELHQATVEQLRSLAGRINRVLDEKVGGGKQAKKARFMQFMDSYGKDTAQSFFPSGLTTDTKS